MIDLLISHFVFWFLICSWRNWGIHIGLVLGIWYIFVTYYYHWWIIFPFSLLISDYLLLFTFYVFLRKVRKVSVRPTSTMVWLLAFDWFCELWFLMIDLMIIDFLFCLLIFDFFPQRKVSVCPASTMVWLLAFGPLGSTGQGKIGSSPARHKTFRERKMQCYMIFSIYKGHTSCDQRGCERKI